MLKQKFILNPEENNIRLTVWGMTPKEVFSNALAGVAAHLVGEDQVLHREGERIDQDIRVEAVDLNSLLVEFLSSVLGRQEMDSVVFTDALFDEFGDNFLAGKIRGVAVEGFERQIRAIAYDTVDVRKNDQGLYECTLTLEI